ncbi:MAG: radical SAM protein [Promethearchaeota archaeon]
MVKVVVKQFKSIINKLAMIDSWFWCKYTVNPYQGCEHACIYCDGRSQRYYMHDDFEQTIHIKSGADRKLDERLAKSRTFLPDVIGFGGVCDAYQPVERKHEISRKLLKVFLKHEFPVFISTKSKLILRDMDILSEIAKKSWCTVNFTITTVNDELSTFLEPGAPSSSERFDAMNLLKKKHPEIQVGTNLMPVIPFLEDSEENLEGIVRETKRNGGDHILFGPGVTLRDTQGEFFFRKIARYNRELEKKLRAFHAMGFRGSADWTFRVNQNCLKFCKKQDIAFRVKRYIPRDFRKQNYHIAEILLNKAYENQLNQKSSKVLFKAGNAMNNLDVAIEELAALGKLPSIPEFTPSILKMIKPMIVKDKTKKRLDDFLK